MLKVTFRGKANVAWTETHSNGKSTTTIRYSSKEIYFDESISLFGKGLYIHTILLKLLFMQKVYANNFSKNIN